jgi:pimeloyl-ACP methyl ester carboxylesterase
MGLPRNAVFWNRWVPAIAKPHRVCRPDLLSCGLSDQPPDGYRYTPETIGVQILAVLDALSLPRVHWVGESSGGIFGLLLAAAHPDSIASLGAVQHTDAHSRSYQAYLRAGSRHASDAMRAFGVGEWCRQTLGYRLDTEWAKRCADGSCTRWTGRSPTSPPRRTIVLRASMSGHCCRGYAPQFCCSAASTARSPRCNRRRSPRPNGRVELFAGYGHGVNLLQPERAPARPWNSGDLSFSGLRRLYSVRNSATPSTNR